MATPSASALSAAKLLYAGNKTAQLYNPTGASQDALNYWATQIDAQGADAAAKNFGWAVDDYAKNNPLPAGTTPAPAPAPAPAGGGLVNDAIRAPLALTPAEKEAKIRSAYLANNRGTIDQTGLDYWMAQPDSQITDPNGALASAFKDATAQGTAAAIDPYYQSQTGVTPSNPTGYDGTAAPTATDEVQAAYQQLFGRQGDDEGLAYWKSTGLIGQALLNAMRASADQMAKDAAAKKGVSTGGVITSPYRTTVNGVQYGFDANGTPVPINQAGGTPSSYGYQAEDASATPAVGSTGYTSKQATATPGATTTNATADSTTSTSYNPTLQSPVVNASAATRGIDPATETVAGQLSGIIAANSPLMQQARSTAVQAMNDRGLGNSSLAIGAGQSAVIQNALPIASSDAGFYNTASAQNQANKQQTGIVNSAAANQVNATNAGIANTEGQFGAAAKNNAGIINAQLGTDVSKTNAAAANTASLQTAANAQQTALTNAAATNAASALGANASNTAALQTAANTQQTNVVNANASNSQLAANADAQNKAAIVAATNLSAQTIASMDAATKVTLANIQAGYQTLIQVSGAANALSQSAMAELNAINQSSLDPASKKAAYNAAIDQYNSAMTLISSINGVPLSGKLPDGTTYDLLTFPKAV